MIRKVISYPIEREIFTQIVVDIMDDDYDLFLDYCWGYKGHLDNFGFIHFEDEFYIVHFFSGIVINWYKNLGRCLTFNKKLSIEDVKKLFKLLKDEINENK